MASKIIKNGEIHSMDFAISVFFAWLSRVMSKISENWTPNVCDTLAYILYGGGNSDEVRLSVRPIKWPSTEYVVVWMKKYTANGKWQPFEVVIHAEKTLGAEFKDFVFNCDKSDPVTGVIKITNVGSSEMAQKFLFSIMEIGMEDSASVARIIQSGIIEFDGGVLE